MLTGTDPKRAKRGHTFNRTACRQFDHDNNTAYHVIMVRTQVSLNESDYEAAKQEAKRLGISFAELLRRLLRQSLPVDDSKPWMRYAGMVNSGDPHISQKIDEIVYGEKP